jgi:ketosteroid isomerase-like protein
MRRIHLIGLLLACFVTGVPAQAQGSADDQAAVWAVVEEIWAAEQRGDVDWVDEMLSADFMGWPANSPAPRSRASTRMWARFDSDQSKGLAHELYPLSIVVHGDMAIVHYLYTTVVQTKDRETVRTNGRYTDVLVRDDGDWKFISWHGGDD